MKLTTDVAANILETTKEAIVVVNDDGDIVYVSERAARLFAYDDGELVGQKIEVLMPDALRKKHEKHRARYWKSPRSRPLVSGLSLKGQRKDGRVFDAEIALTPIETDKGVLVSSTVRDISADDTSEAYFRNVLESAPDAMIIIDHYGRIATRSQNAGYAPFVTNAWITCS